MNLLHLKYAVEVEKTRSIKKAAENLFIGQPNLSRAIKDLEKSLGITIFNRTTKGISLTPQGEEFMQYARNIISQVDAMESMYKDNRKDKQLLSVSVCRASYISAAFISFMNSLDSDKRTEIYYKETNGIRTIKNVVQDNYHMGIVRFMSDYYQYYKTIFSEKGLSYELLYEFPSTIVMSADHPLANKDTISLSDLEEYIEIAHSDSFLPSLPTMESNKTEHTSTSARRVYIFERASQMELLSSVSGTYMWGSTLPEDQLKRFGLVEKKCSDTTRTYNDMLIYKNGYSFTNYDKKFIEEVKKVIKNSYFIQST